MSVITEDYAFELYRDYAGASYEYLDGHKKGANARVIGYDIINNNTLLVFKMSDGNLVPYKMFQDQLMMQIEGANDFVAVKRPNAGKTQEEIIAEKLNLMTDEEEKLWAERNRGHHRPNTNSTKQVNQEEIKEVSKNPINIILDKRKEKPLISIPISLDIEFISKQTFTLIDSTFDNSIQDIKEYFMDKINLENIKKDIEKSIEVYIKTEYQGISKEEIEAEEAIEIITVEAEEVFYD